MQNGFSKDVSIINDLGRESKLAGQVDLVDNIVLPNGDCFKIGIYKRHNREEDNNYNGWIFVSGKIADADYCKPTLIRAVNFSLEPASPRRYNVSACRLSDSEIIVASISRRPEFAVPATRIDIISR